MKVDPIDNILSITKDPDYLENPSKFTPLDMKLSNGVDQMVYELYGLTEDEIKVVEGMDYEKQ